MLKVRDNFIAFITDALTGTDIPVKVWQDSKDNLRVNALNIKFLSDNPVLGKYPDGIIKTTVSLDLLVQEDGSSSAERRAMSWAGVLLNALGVGKYETIEAWLTWVPFDSFVFMDIPNEEAYVHKNITLELTGATSTTYA